MKRILIFTLLFITNYSCAMQKGSPTVYNEEQKILTCKQQLKLEHKNTLETNRIALKAAADYTKALGK